MRIGISLLSGSVRGDVALAVRAERAEAARAIDALQRHSQLKSES